MALGGEGAVARGDDAQHALGGEHADIDEGRIAGGVEPERGVQPLRQRGLQRPIDRSYQGGATAGGQGAPRLQHDGQRQALFGAFRQQGQARGAGIVMQGGHGPGHIPGQAFGQAAVHRIPVLVEEHPGDGDLHDRHRQDDDQQAAPEQALGQPAFEAAGDGEFHRPGFIGLAPGGSRPRAPSAESAGSSGRARSCGAGG